MTRALRPRWLCIAIGLLPFNTLRVWAYRLICRYTVGRRVNIGWLTLLQGDEVSIGDDCHFDMLVRITGIRHIGIGASVHIGRLSQIAGMDRLAIGDKTSIGGGTSILTPSWHAKYGKSNPSFIAGTACILTSSHHIDVTDDVILGDRVTIGGAFSTFWTHGVSRDRTGPIAIGDGCYLGAGVHIGPKVVLAPRMIVGMGAVVTRSFDTPGCTIGGVPARVLRGTVSSPADASASPNLAAGSSNGRTTT